MITMIVAMAKNHAIGKDNALLWHLPEDLKFFKEKTSGHTIVMGRKTFESLPFVLPKREHWVLTSAVADLPEHEQVRGFSSVEDVLKAMDEKEQLFIIGGAQIYNAFLPYADRLYITKIDAEFEGDAFFPAFDEAEFTLVDESEAHTSENYPWSYRFTEYTRKKG